jgi:hypothetical protein
MLELSKKPTFVITDIPELERTEEKKTWIPVIFSPFNGTRLEAFLKLGIFVHISPVYLDSNNF